jgi:hypothetical protein
MYAQRPYSPRSWSVNFQWFRSIIITIKVNEKVEKFYSMRRVEATPRLLQNIREKTFFLKPVSERYRCILPQANATLVSVHSSRTLRDTT